MATPIAAEMGMKSTVQDRTAQAHERPSLDEWVIAVLQQRGTQTLDQLGKLLPEANWAQLFLAIDRLSRSGKISLWSPGFGDYLITVNHGIRPAA
ncbi:MAG TPA: hypothetical protein VHQ67_04645 [Nitrospiraceae bacterium]|jgi:hypothetical protein|nr:hypothetical protein [Nitrospiraceae bacterium]